MAIPSQRLEEDLKEQTQVKRKPKRKKKGRKLGFFLIVLMVLLAAGLVATRFDLSPYTSQLKALKFWGKSQEAGPEQQSQEEELPLVKTFHVVRSDFKDTHPVIGTVKGFEELDLTFQTNGLIEEIRFQEGDLIGSNDVVAVLDQTEVNYKVDFQKANYETAKSEFLVAAKKLTNAEKMFEIGGIVISKLDESILEADRAAMKMKSAEVEHKSALSEVDRTLIKAPIDGVLGVIHMEPGEYVSVSSAPKVVTLIDISRVFVDVGIIERDIDKIAIGLTAVVTVDTYPDIEFQGEIANMLPVIEGKSRTLTARVEVDNSNTLLLPGMFARVQIAVYETTDAIMIPSVCLNKGKEGYVVNVVNAEDIVEARPVEIGYITTDYVEILAGLEVDEFVVTETQQEIKDGDKVRISDIEESPFV